MLQKFLTVILVVGIGFWVVTHPERAANFVDLVVGGAMRFLSALG